MDVLLAVDWKGKTNGTYHSTVRLTSLLYYLILRFTIYVCLLVAIVSTSLQPHGLIALQVPLPNGSSIRSPGKNTRVAALPFSRGSSWPRAQTPVCWISGRFFTIWATKKSHLTIKVHLPVHLCLKPLQYCKVISLQLIKINEEKKEKTEKKVHLSRQHCIGERTDTKISGTKWEICTQIT